MWIERRIVSGAQINYPYSQQTISIAYCLGLGAIILMLFSDNWILWHRFRHAEIAARKERKLWKWRQLCPLFTVPFVLQILEMKRQFELKLFHLLCSRYCWVLNYLDMVKNKLLELIKCYNSLLSFKILFE